MEKWTFNSRATALVDIPAVSVTTAPSKPAASVAVLINGTLQSGLLLWQPEAHLCNIHAVRSATPVRWMDYLCRGEVLTDADLDRSVNNIWDKWIFCVYRKSFRSFSSAHEKWEQKQKCWVYIFCWVYVYQSCSQVSCNVCPAGTFWWATAKFINILSFVFKELLTLLLAPGYGSC